MIRKTLLYTTSGIGTLFVALVLTVAMASGDGRDGRGHHGDDGHHGFGHHGADPDKMLARIDRHLDLDASQEERVGAILKERAESMQAMRDEHAQGLRELIVADSIEAADVLRVLDARPEPAELRERMRGELAETAAAIHAVLTPEQRQLAADMIAERDGHGRHGHHGWRFWRDRH